jgi:aromatic-L-amino-acid decarboxylase
VGDDAAETRDLSAALAAVLPALERHLGEPATGAEFGSAASWRATLDEPLPASGRGAEETLRRLADPVVRHGQRLTAPGFLGWITTGPTVVPTVAALATALAGTQRYLGHTGNFLEELALRWLAQACGVVGMDGVFSSSGSVANLLALGAARQRAYERLGHDPARDGLAGAPRGRVYSSTELHHSIIKAAGVLGLGRSGVVLLPVDGRQRVDVAALRRAVAADVAAGLVPVAVVGAAGSTNTGAVDDLAALADVAAEHGTWFHVDGAYGLFGRLDERVAERYAGLDRADSAVVDPHKWLATPSGIAATLVRDRELLARAFTGEPSDYIEGGFDTSWTSSAYDAMGLPYHDWALDLTAPARGVVVWAALHELGLDGLRARVVRDNDLARRVAERARRHERLELLTEPELSICCFRYRRDGLDQAGLDQLNQQVLRRLHAESPYVPSFTRVDGRYALRPCFINPRTTAADADALVDWVVRLGDRLDGSAPRPDDGGLGMRTAFTGR